MGEVSRRTAQALGLRGAPGARGRAAGRGAGGLPSGADLPGQRAVPPVRAQLHHRALEPGRAAAERVLGRDHPGGPAARAVAPPAGAAPGRAGHRRPGVRGADPVRGAALARGGGRRAGAVRSASAGARAVRADRRRGRPADLGGAGHPGLAAGRAAHAGGGRGRAAARRGGDVPGPGPDHDRPGRAVPAGKNPAGAHAPDPAGHDGRMLSHPGRRVPGLVRVRARPVELHHVRWGVPVRAGRGLRRLPGAHTARLRAAAVPGRAARAAQRGLLHLEPAVAAVDLHSPGREVKGRGGARLQPADPAASAARLRRGRRPRPALRLLPRPRRRAGAVLAGLPAVRHLRPARPGGLRLDRQARLPGTLGRARACRLPGRLRAVGLPARPGARGRAGAGPGRADQEQRPRPGDSPVHRQRDRDPAPPGHVRHLRLAVPAAAAQPDPGGRGARSSGDGLSRNRQQAVSRHPGGHASLTL